MDNKIVFNKYTEMEKTIYNLKLNETLHAEMKLVRRRGHIN
jgi:hypothetical protein